MLSSSAEEKVLSAEKQKTGGIRASGLLPFTQHSALSTQHSVLDIPSLIAFNPLLGVPDTHSHLNRLCRPNVS